MEITSDVLESIGKYYSVLEHIGYKPDKDVFKLIVYTFLEELLDGPFTQYITEEDYNSISNALYCIYGSCMIPYPDYKRGIDSISKPLYNEYRITETKILRSTEESELRVKS